MMDIFSKTSGREDLWGIVSCGINTGDEPCNKEAEDMVLVMEPGERKTIEFGGGGRRLMKILFRLEKNSHHIWEQEVRLHWIRRFSRAPS